MAISKLKAFLDEHQVKYVTVSHSKAFTAQEVAASAHISGDRLAKVVIVKLDGELAMVVLPASDRLDLDRLKQDTEAGSVELADEDEFKSRFADCELGAMPPFGNLYEVPVYVAERLREQDQIAFNAGTHTELVQLAYDDFERLAEPELVSL